MDPSSGSRDEVWVFSLTQIYITMHNFFLKKKGLKIPLRAKPDEFLDPPLELFTTEVQFFQLKVLGGDTAKLLKDN